MKNFKISKFFIILILLYLVTRLTNLLIIPIFTDEAIYSFWAQVALHDPANRFISLEDGKQPLFIWFAAISQRFVSDPLVANRLVSVAAGLVSTVLIYFIAKKFFSEKVARTASLLYILLPFSLLYDRLAVFDSLLTMFGLISFLLTVMMAENPHLDLALLNGFAIGLGMITKSSATFFLYLLPFSLIIFNFKKDRKKLPQWLFFTAVTIFLSEIIYNSLRLSPLFYLINRKNHEFIRTFSEVLASPLGSFLPNTKTIISWLIDYNGPLFILMSLLGIIWGFFKKQKYIILLSFYIGMPFMTEVFFNKILYPRFALFYFPFIIILAAFAVVSILEKNQKAGIALIGLTLLMPIITSFWLITKPTNAKIAPADKDQYISSWPAGYGVREIVEILRTDSSKGKVTVGTEGTFGLLPFALKIYFRENDNISIQGYWPASEVPQSIMSAANGSKTYFVFNETQSFSDKPDNPRLKLVGKYQKGNGNSFMRLYKILPSRESP